MIELGGSGGLFGGNYNPERYKKIMEESLRGTVDVEFDASVNGLIADYLSECPRDVGLTEDRLSEIKDKLGNEIEGSFKTLFGGSVKKHTYVDGLSDVDVLLCINRTEFQDMTPPQILDSIKKTLISSNIKDVDEIRVGSLAITIRYKNGDEIQLLPSIKKGEGFKIPDKDGWSNVIHPENFAKKLVKVNQENHGKVVPTIKMVKGILSNLPDDQKLKGYHIEALAISAFDGVNKSMSNQERLLYYFQSAKENVKKPITDSTKQSDYVDYYLGAENSPGRLRASYTLDRIYRRMKRASELHDIEEWQAILGE